MSGRYDFVKDPKDRRWIARWQVASVVMFVALLVAVMLYGPTTEQTVAGAVGAQGEHPDQRVQGVRPRAGPPEPRPMIGYGEGA